MFVSRWRRRLPSPALIVSCLALFAALGGGAYAGTRLSTNSLHWHNATTVNGWTLYGSGYAPAGYAKDANGVVHLRGGISNGTGYAFKLPKGYRPKHHLYLPIYTVSGTVGSVIINPNGRVDPFGSYAGIYTSLDGISFGAGE
jgi:hypothetical protein